MIRILTIDSEYESAKRLGYETTTEVDEYNTYPNDIIIRWGNSQSIYKQNNNGPAAIIEFNRVINTSRAIRTNVEKDGALKLLSLVVNTPSFWNKGDKVPTGKTVVYRTIHHQSGRGFNIQKGPFIVENGNYATSWIPSKYEYRVWFCGKATMCGIRTNRIKCVDKYPCRSMWGYTFKRFVPAELHKATIEAAKIIGLEVGAADVIYYSKKYYFLELNSAPTVDKQKIEDFYKINLKKLIKQKFNKKGLNEKGTKDSNSQDKTNG